MPNIRNREQFAKALWDWDFLNECWSGRIRPTDIDGAIERNGYFLFLEGKPKDGALTRGQEILFKILTREFLKSEVLILYGEPGMPIEYQIFYRGQAGPRKQCDRREIIAFCKAWFNAVDSQESKIGL